MILSDYHIHTTFCDGKNSPREYILEAIKMGLSEIGFSVHSWTFFDESYCLKNERIDEYINEINSLKREFADKIKILCGVEQDVYSTMSVEKFDYAIGSVHYVLVDGKYLTIDESKEKLIGIIKEHFNGDCYKFCDLYFKTVAKVAKISKIKMIGHFDLVSKYNKNNCIFDENDSRYISSWKKAVDELLKYNIPFEINTGAISRGHKNEPYPSAKIIEYINNKGGKFILSSDSHSVNGLCYQFDKYNKFVK